MNNKLKSLFPSLLSFSENESNYPEGYNLYMTENKEIIGIKAEETSKRDEALLSSFLTVYHPQVPSLNENEKLWVRRINEDAQLPRDVLPTFRLVYFSFKKHQIKAGLFKEAIETLFGKSVPILWNNESSGIIIEEIDNPKDESLSYEDIIDVLMSDLYIRIRFLVGPFIDRHAELQTVYTSMQADAETIFTYFDKQVVSHSEAILSLFLNQASFEFQEKAIDLILKEVKDDKELLHTVKIFFQSNLNATLAAKELHLHRNSLQYRLDKFIEKTKIDIRLFENAALVYFILLTNTHEG